MFGLFKSDQQNYLAYFQLGESKNRIKMFF